MHRAKGPAAKGDELFNAARENKLQQVQLMISKGAKVDKVDSSGRTALWWAAASGHVALTTYLLELGADIRLEDITCCSPALAAAQGGQKEIIQLFLAREAEVLAKPPPAKRAKTANSANRCKLVEMVSGDGWTLLHKAARFGHAELCKELIANGANPNGEPAPAQMWTPLFLAAEVGATAVIKALLEGGADPNLQRGTDPVAAIHVACRVKKLDAVKALISGGADPMLPAEATGQTALHYAAESGSVPITQFLLKTNKVHTSAKDNFGRLPLHVAAGTKHDAVLKELLPPITDEALLSAGDASGQSPLIQAIVSKSLKCVELLVGAGADVSRPSADDMTPVHFAAAVNNVPILTYLIQHGGKGSLKEVDVYGRTPLEAARVNNSTAAVKYLKTVTT